MGRIVDIFAWNQKWGGYTGNTLKHWKKAAFNEEFCSENNFETVLATFCCYECGYVCCYDLLKWHTQHLFLTVW